LNTTILRLREQLLGYWKIVTVLNMLHGEIMDFEDRGTEFRPEDIQYVHAAWVLQTLEAAVSPSPSQGFPQRKFSSYSRHAVRTTIVEH
jgi:hypothetical protein